MKKTFYVMGFGILFFCTYVVSKNNTKNIVPSELPSGSNKTMVDNNTIVSQPPVAKQRKASPGFVLPVAKILGK